MIKCIVHHIWPLLFLLLVGCNRYDPAIKECFAAKAGVLDTLEAEIDISSLVMVKTDIPRYDVPDVTKFCNPYRFSFVTDSGVVACRFDKYSNTIYDFESCRVVLQDTAFICNKVLHFYKQILALTSGTGFVFDGYVSTGKGVRKKKPMHGCLIVLYKENKEYHLCCCAPPNKPQNKDEMINIYKKEHPKAVIYEIYKNWILIQLSESLYDLHVNQCG